MVYTSSFLTLRANGIFGTTASPIEEWSWGVKLAPMSLTTESTPEELEAWLATIAPLFSTLHTSASLNAGTTCLLTKLTAAVVGTDGRYVGGGQQPTSVFEYATPPAGLGVRTMPFSTAIVVTLRTARPRGRGHVGRFFLPRGQAPSDPDGTLNTSQQTGIAGIAATWADGVNNAAAAQFTFGPPPVISVMSSLDAGVTEPVIRVEVGQRMDHMESRERKIPEQYLGNDLASAGLVRAARAARLIDLSNP